VRLFLFYTQNTNWWRNYLLFGDFWWKKPRNL